MRLISDDTLAVVTIWQEARGEPHEGKVAVGEVIRNRMKGDKRSAGAVVLAPMQFSGWNAHDPNRLPSVQIDDQDPVVQDCQRAWAESEQSDLVGGATLYFNPALAQPSWASQVHFVVAVGGHRFYREEP